MVITEEVAVHLNEEDLEIVQERHEVNVKGRKMAVNILVINEVLKAEIV